MKNRRSAIEREIDVLRIIFNNSQLKPTHIMYKANLSWRETTKILNYLKKLKLINSCDTEFFITSKGIETLDKYHELISIYLPLMDD